MTTTIGLVYITTAAYSANLFLKGQLSYMRERGFDVIVISAPGDELPIIREREKVTTIAVPMEREISLLKDLISLLRLYRVLRRIRPAIVIAATPKAGLLGMIAASAAHVPVRVYSLMGLRLETTSGLKRFVLGVTERCASALAHRVFCVSESLRRLYVVLGYTSQAKTCVLGEGSVNGLDADEFTPSPQASERAQALRAHLAIPNGAPVVGFVGRFTRDKGLPELLDAFDQVLVSFPDARLLLVGDFEDGDPVPECYAERLRSHPRVIMAGFVPDPSSYYPVMDVLAFPSHREGIGTVLLEAAAAQVPSVVFKATGSVDAVRDGVTGTVVPLGDVELFAHSLKSYLNDEHLRRQHGQAGRERVLRHFRPEVIWELLYEEYGRLLETRNQALFQRLVASPGTVLDRSHQRTQKSGRPAKPAEP
jgi:glycosyltransferase involved in cell wall biosynthesis